MSDGSGRTFAAHVAARLAMGAREYGDTSCGRPLADLLAEILEECADVGGWASIAGRVLAQRGDMTPARRAAVARSLGAAVMYGERAWLLLRGALDEIEANEEAS